MTSPGPVLKGGLGTLLLNMPNQRILQPTTNFYLMFRTICLPEFIILKQAYLELTLWKNPAFFHVKFNRKLHMGVSCHAMLKVNTDTFWKLVQKFVVFIFIIWLIQMNKQSDLDRSMHKKIAKIEISENIEWKVWFLFTVFTFP